MGDLHEKKAALREKLDSLYGDIAALEKEALGLDNLELRVEPGDPTVAAAASLAADDADDGGSPTQAEMVREVWRGTELTPSDVRQLQGYVRRLDAWRDHYKSLEDGRGLLINERHYAKALEILLANQRTQLEHRRQHVEELHSRLQETQSNDKSETQAAISDALQTPMQLAADTIINLIKRLGENSDVAIPLAQVLAQISANDMYQPSILHNENDPTSPSSQQWITQNFSSGYKSRLERRRGGVVGLEQTKKTKKRVRRSSVILMTMQNIQFDQFDYEESELPQLVVDFFGKWSLFEEFKVPVPVFKNFVEDIKKHYHPNPYHNFRHAFDVCQMMYCFLTLNKASDQLETLDIFILLVSTLIHDVDHNGLNNSFHINSQSPLAVLYNDISVLENHHCSFANKLLARTENNIFANMEDAEQKVARKRMIECVLSTDMSTHFDVTNKFKLLVDSKQFHKEEPDDRQAAMNFLMHSADLSNPVRPFPLAKRWAYLIIDEFTQQGDMEKRLSLPVSPMCDRETLMTDGQKAKMQVDFMDYVVTPMYTLMGDFLPNMDTCLDLLKSNRENYQKIREGSATAAVLSAVAPEEEEEEEEEEEDED